jgi:hypothetical protein
MLLMAVRKHVHEQLNTISDKQLQYNAQFFCFAISLMTGLWSQWQQQYA